MRLIFCLSDPTRELWFGYKTCDEAKRFLNVLWNTHILILKSAKHAKVNPTQLKLDKKLGTFGIIQGNFKKIIKSIEKGIPPQKILQEGVKGKDLGITVPVKGKASTSESAFKSLQQTFQSKQKKLNEKFEKIATDNGLYSSYG